MEVDIQSPYFELTEGLKSHIQRKLKFALSRMEAHITAISISLSNINGAGNGREKHCRLQISIVGMEDVVIRDTQTDLYNAIDRAMQRASRTVARKIAQQQQQKKRPKKIKSIDHLDQDGA